MERKSFLTILLITFIIFLIKVGLAQNQEILPPLPEETVLQQTATPTTVVPGPVNPQPAPAPTILPMPTFLAPAPKVVPEEACKGLKGLEYRKCLINLKRQVKEVKQEVQELKQEIKEVAKENIEDINKEIQRFIRLGRNIFVLAPSGRAMAGGKIDNIENNILTLNTLGFTTKWNIENTKGDKEKLQVNQEVKITGRWDVNNNIFVADHVKIIGEKPVILPVRPVQPLQPQAIKPQINDLIKQLMEMLKNLQPQPQPQPVQPEVIPQP
jgi:hypothetical protein